jgi:hypothetical protein
MAYRRGAESGPGSSKWRLAQCALLSECGIPDEVADSDRRWAYVLYHGDDKLRTGWQACWISPDQAGRLLERLRADLQREVGYDLVRALRLRVGETDA